MSISTRSINHPVTTIMIFVLVCGIAAIFIPSLAVALNPETTIPVLSISTTYASAGPEEIERNVTKVIENAVSAVDGVESISSTSSQGSSNVMLEFDYKTDLDEAQSEVESAVNSVAQSLPDGADAPVVRRFDMSSLPIITLGLKGELPLERLQELGEDLIQARLERIKGVASASVSGGRAKVLRVEVSQNRLAAYNLTLGMISDALGKQNILLTGGDLVRGDLNYQIRTDEKLSSLQEVKEVVVKTLGTQDGGNRAIRLEDIAEVSEGYEDASRLVYMDGVPGINVSILQDSDSNSVQIAREVYKAVEELNGILPTGAELVVLSDDTTMVGSTLREVYSSALQGMALSGLFLLFFLRNVKAMLIIVFTMPISILVTLLCMHFLGLTLNTISLTGLIMGLGINVDTSIVILDSIFRYRERGTKSRTAAILGSQDLLSALIGSTLTTLCVFIPIILFRDRLGMMGQLFNDLVITVCISLVVPLLVGITLIPVLCGPIIGLDTRVQKPLKNRLLIRLDGAIAGFLEALERGYQKALEFSLRNRFLVVSLTVVLLVSALVELSGFGLNLFPRMDTDDTITINVTMPLGSTMASTQAELEKLERHVRNVVRGYDSLLLTVGGGRGGPMGGTYKNRGSLQILLPDPKDQLDTPAAIKAKLASYIAEVPGAEFTFTSGRGFQSGSAVDVQIRSNDQEASLSAASEIKRIIAERLGYVENLAISLDEGSPELRIDIDRNRAALFGFSASQIAREIRASVYGTTAATYDKAGDVIDVVVRLREEDRKTLSDLDSIFLIDARGVRIPASNFATISNSTAPETISREDKERIIHVEGDLKAGSPTAATEMGKIVQELLDEYYVPREGVTVSIGGEMESIGDSLPVFILVILVAIFLVYGVMASQFESFKDPFIIFCSIPLMFIGVVWIYKITGDTMSLFSMVGLVALAGLVVNNGIVLVDYTNTLRKRGKSVFEACVEAGQRRLRPILISTFTNILSVVPLALFPGEGLENVNSIAKTMCGGLTVSSFMTIFLTPVLYSLFNPESSASRESTVICTGEMESQHGTN